MLQSTRREVIDLIDKSSEFKLLKEKNNFLDERIKEIVKGINNNFEQVRKFADALLKHLDLELEVISENESIKIKPIAKKKK